MHFMNELFLLIICALAGGLFSLVGGITLISHENHRSLARHATSFAAGALLAAAFVDLLPGAIEGSTTPGLIPLATLAGILLFFLLESSFHWFHHHHHKEDNAAKTPTGTLLLLSDMLHNLFDGIAIAAGFLVDAATGITVTLAVCAHEIPQEIGEFAFLSNKGMARKKIIVFNVLTSFATLFAAVSFYLLGQQLQLEMFLPFALAIVAGFFIYIAVSDIIPSIHQRGNRKFVFQQTLLLLAGVSVVSLLIFCLRGFLE